MGIAYRLRWLDKKLVDYVVGIVDQMEGSQIIRGRRISVKTIKKNLSIIELDRNMVYNGILWHCLIHVADHT
jgi:hypothetical protein